MSEDFDEFFERHTHWGEHEEDSSHEDVSPKPHKSRRELHKQRVAKSRKRSILIALSVVIVLLLTLFTYAGYSVVRYLRSAQDSSISEDWPGPGFGSVEFVVNPGEGAMKVGANLVKAQVVKSQSNFATTVSSNNKILYPGIYKLKKHMSSMDVVDILSDRTKAQGFLEVKAGEKAADIIHRASALSNISFDKFKAIIDNKGAGILPPEANGSFEAWFEPGVYNVKSMKSAEEILSTMVKKRIAKLDSLGIPKGENREKSLIIASIAEAEVNSSEYYGKVVRVILNRLSQDMPLGMDSTIGYGAGVEPIKLTQAMLDDPNNIYNTRIHKGLPPTPINTPGDNALMATLKPQDGPWIYFVTTNLKTGETKFTADMQEFLKFRDEYKRSNANAN